MQVCKDMLDAAKNPHAHAAVLEFHNYVKDKLHALAKEPVEENKLVFRAVLEHAEREGQVDFLRGHVYVRPTYDVAL